MFYNNLKVICDERGVKITNLVLECGGSTGCLHNWKKGVYPNSDIVAKLATRLGVTTDYLLLGKGNLRISNISKSTVGAVGDNSIGTVTVNNNSALVGNGNTYYGATNIAVGNNINQTNVNTTYTQTIIDYDKSKIIQEIDDVICHLNKEQCEVLELQIHNTIENFKKLLGIE